MFTAWMGCLFCVLMNALELLTASHTDAREVAVGGTKK